MLLLPVPWCNYNKKTKNREKALERELETGLRRYLYCERKPSRAGYQNLAFLLPLENSTKQEQEMERISSVKITH